HHKGSDECITGGSPHPGHVGIVVTVAKGVFGRCLRFADPAQSIEGLGLGQRSHSRGREPLVKQVQQWFAAREERVARNGNVPYPGTRCWWWQQAKLSRLFAKNLTEPLAKIGSGKGRAVFPATDIDGCRAYLVGQLLL